MKNSNNLENIPKEFINIQYLRLIACVIVVVHHCYQLVPKHGMGDIGSQFELGAAGVDIFFPISGFIICFITEGRERTPLNFFLHRLGRVAPLYWILTIFFSIILIKIPSLFSSSKFDIPALLASILFFPWPHATLEGAVPLLMPGWTLNFEFLFYSIFAVSIFISKKHRSLICALVLLFLSITGLLLKPAGAISQFYTSPMLIEFVYGIVIASLMKANRLPSFWISTVVLVLGFVALAAMVSVPVGRLAQTRPFLWGLPGALILLGAVGMEVKRGFREIKLLRLLGDASYSVYLTNLFTIGVLGVIWTKFGLGHKVSDVFLVTFGVFFSLFIGYLLHIMVEIPTSKAAKAYLKRLDF